MKSAKKVPAETKSKNRKGGGGVGRYGDNSGVSKSNTNNKTFTKLPYQLQILHITKLDVHTREKLPGGGAVSYTHLTLPTTAEV